VTDGAEFFDEDEYEALLDEGDAESTPAEPGA
jgi:hypothetical protein